MRIEFPVFVRAKDSGEIAAFNSIQDIQTHVERVDIENEEYEAWDNDGLPVQIELQDPPLWIKLCASAEDREPDQLRRVLRDFANSVGVQLPEQLPSDAFSTILDQIRAAHERAMLERSPVRRFFARFRHPPTS
jgi:hypothetical protein